MLSKWWLCVDISVLSGDRVFSNNGLILQPWSGSLPENEAVSHEFIELKRPLDQWLQSHTNKRKSTHDNHKTQKQLKWPEALMPLIFRTSFQIILAPCINPVLLKWHYQGFGGSLSQNYDIYYLGATAILCRAPFGKSVWPAVWVRRGAFPRAFHTNEADKNSGANFRRWICICGLQPSQLE